MSGVKFEYADYGRDAVLLNSVLVKELENHEPCTLQWFEAAKKVHDLVARRGAKQFLKEHGFEEWQLKEAKGLK